MRTLTYFVAVSLDGFIAAPDGDFSAFPVQGDHIEMIISDYRDTLPDVALQALGLTADGSRFDTTLMGWNTYAAGFPATRNPYPHTRQFVFSRTRRPQDVAEGITLTGDNPVDVVRELKKQRGAGIWLCGGGQLAAALRPQIDVMVLKVNPVVLGDGVPLFAGDHDPTSYRLRDSTAYGSGVLVNEYVRE